jgi:hypothetical protein
MQSAVAFRSVVVVLLVTGAAGLSKARQQVLVPAPMAEEPVLDGRVSEVEQVGTSAALSGGGQVWFGRSERGLYVGVQPGDAGIAHVCVATGERVAILHSSASLGSASYESGEATARRLTSFEWERPSDTSTFLKTHGWTGAMPATSQTDREFLLGPQWAVDGLLRIAIAYGGFGPTRRWPAAVADDCVQTGLLMGSAPAAATFRPAEWAAVRISETR